MASHSTGPQPPAEDAAVVPASGSGSGSGTGTGTGSLQVSLLPKATISLLSSGQILTSAACVVKELLENALDSGATSAEVHLREAGVEQVIVKDNGKGVGRAEMEVMAMPHTTSKIRNFRDIETLQTYGFRGEALNAVARMAKLEIASRPEGCQTGVRVTYKAEGSVARVEDPVAMTKGTVVAARDLFHALPVRRKMLNTPVNKRTELKKVQLLLHALALAKPEVRLSLHNNGNTVFVKQACNTRRAAVQQIMKASLGNKLDLVTLDVGPSIHLEMYLPHPPKPCPSTLGRANTDSTFILVNNRPVEIKPVFKLLRKIFSEASSAASDRNPVAAVIIQVASDTVDVNLEPNKSSVMLHEQEELLTAMNVKLRTFYGLDKHNEQTEHSKEDSLNQSAFDKTPHNISDASSSISQVSVTSPEGGEPIAHRSVPKFLQNLSPEVTVSFQKNVMFEPNLTSTQSSSAMHSAAKLPQLDTWSLGHVVDKPVHSLHRGSVLTQREDGKLALAPPPPLETKTTQRRDAKRNRSMSDDSLLKIDAFLNRSQHIKSTPVQISNSGDGPGAKKAKEYSLTDQDMHVLKRRHQEKKAHPANTLDALAVSTATPRVKGNSAVKVTRRLLPVKFNINKCRQANETEPKGKKVSIGIVGKPEKLPYWVCRTEQSFFALNHHRFAEVQLFDRLMATAQLESKKLPKPLDLTQVPGWNMELLDLCTKRLPKDDFGNITDTRLTCNGAVVHAASSPELVQVPTRVNFFGVAEVLAIFKLLCEDPDMSVTKARPAKVAAYLKGEAVRVVRQNPPGIDREAAGKMWSQLLRCGDGVGAKCLHGKPISERLE